MIWLFRFTVSLVMAFTLLAGNASAQGFFDHPLIGKAAPDFILDTLDAKGVHFQELNKGKKTIVFFWATWCPHCREQIKELRKIEPKLVKEGVVVTLVDIGEDAATVRKFVAAGGYNFPVFLDVKSYVAEMYEVFGVPTLFFIGPEGKVREMLNFMPEDFEQIFK
jgi:cytochrome c biogenesis protein CcmG/thiol:disulfide interchange protein DsbE